MKTEKIVNLSMTLTGMSFTTMSQEEIEGMLVNAVRCQVLFTKPNGENVVLDVFGDIQATTISFSDEFGVEID